MAAGRERPGALAAGAAMGTAGHGASGFGSGFVEPMGENGLGMRRGPAVEQHLVHPKGSLSLLRSDSLRVSVQHSNVKWTSGSPTYVCGRCDVGQPHEEESRLG